MAIKYGILVDSRYCTGCRSCEMACNQENNFAPGVSGLKVMTLGPLNIADEKWQFDNFAVPTEWCTTCPSRRSQGKRPACTQHCQGQCITIDEIDKLIPQISCDKHKLFVIR